jgi:hypothetical protein
MFLVQSLLACQFFFVFFDNLQSLSLPFGFESLFTWVADGLGAASSVALFGESDERCFLSYVQVDGSKYSFFYGLLTGYTILSGSLTVGTLTQHMFSLSGSVFLIAMR